MARIRTIKPEFWSSEQVMNISPLARLLFIGLWNFCDDGGNHPVSFKTLKALVFPSDDVTTQTIENLVTELMAVGLLAKYSAASRDYWHVTGWHHQRIDKPTLKYPVYRLQDIDDLSTNTQRHIDDSSSQPQGVLDDQSTTLPISLPEISPTEGKGEDSIGKNKYNPREALTALGVENQVVEDWLELRKVKKALVTHTAVQAIIKEAHKAGITLQAALIISCQRGWTGFKAEWMQNQTLNAQPVTNILPWFMTASGIDEKGKELGLALEKDEQPPSYKLRICRAAGVTEDEWRKAHVDCKRVCNPLYPSAKVQPIKPPVDRTGKPSLREVLKAQGGTI